MDARTLESKMNYIGMERAARKLLLDLGCFSPKELAVMTSLEVCEKLLQNFEVVSYTSECISVVKNSDLATYNSIVVHLER